MISKTLANINTQAEDAVVYTAVDEKDFLADLEVLEAGSRELSLLMSLDKAVAEEGKSAASDLAYATLGFEADKDNAFSRAYQAVKAFFGRVWAKLRQWWNWLFKKNPVGAKAEKKHEEQVKQVLQLEKMKPDDVVEESVEVQATPEQVEALKEAEPEAVVIDTLVENKGSKQDDLTAVKVSNVKVKNFNFTANADLIECLEINSESLEELTKTLDETLSLRANGEDEFLEVFWAALKKRGFHSTNVNRFESHNGLIYDYRGRTIIKLLDSGALDFDQWTEHVENRHADITKVTDNSAAPKSFSNVDKALLSLESTVDTFQKTIQKKFTKVNLAEISEDDTRLMKFLTSIPTVMTAIAKAHQENCKEFSEAVSITLK